MSYYLSAIKIYPNLINGFDLASPPTATNVRDTALNYDPENEPSIVNQGATNSGGEAVIAGNGPLYDLVDDKLGDLISGPVVAIDTNGETADPTIDIDLTKDITIDTMIVANHNFDTVKAQVFPKIGGASVTLNNAFSGPQAFTGEYRLQGETVVGSASVNPPPANGVLLMEFTEATDNDWQIATVNDQATYLSDIRIGEIILSKKWTSPHAPEVADWQDTSTFGNVTNRTPGGQTYSTGYHGERKEWSLSWQHITDADKLLLQAAFRITKTTRHPFFIDLGEAVLPWLHFVKLIAEPVYTSVSGGQYWNVSFRIREEL